MTTHSKLLRRDDIFEMNAMDVLDRLKALNLPCSSSKGENMQRLLNFIESTRRVDEEDLSILTDEELATQCIMSSIPVGSRQENMERLRSRIASKSRVQVVISKEDMPVQARASVVPNIIVQMPKKPAQRRRSSVVVLPLDRKSVSEASLEPKLVFSKPKKASNHKLSAPPVLKRTASKFSGVLVPRKAAKTESTSEANNLTYFTPAVEQSIHFDDNTTFDDVFDSHLSSLKQDTGMTINPFVMDKMSKDGSVEAHDGSVENVELKDDVMEAKEMMDTTESPQSSDPTENDPEDKEPSADPAEEKNKTAATELMTEHTIPTLDMDNEEEDEEPLKEAMEGTPGGTPVLTVASDEKKIDEKLTLDHEDASANQENSTAE